MGRERAQWGCTPRPHQLPHRRVQPPGALSSSVSGRWGSEGPRPCHGLGGKTGVREAAPEAVMQTVYTCVIAPPTKYHVPSIQRLAS